MGKNERSIKHQQMLRNMSSIVNRGKFERKVDVRDIKEAPTTLQRMVEAINRSTELPGDAIISATDIFRSSNGSNEHAEEINESMEIQDNSTISEFEPKQLKKKLKKKFFAKNVNKPEEPGYLLKKEKVLESKRSRYES